jgi:lipopolysaccharide export system permease protein
MLQRFIPVLAMTFFICLFIVMMQFLWRYIDDLVGKGLGIDVVAELFGYAALTMVPTALPLAVLLASLMTFGNLGETFELTAMKAAGISLFRIMRPLIILMVGIAIGAFFFQNDVLPIAQTKMYTLLFSMRQKSPEIEIPEQSFYDQIPGMNLYLEHKNRETGMLYDLIIYDVTRGIENSRIILSDSGKMSFTEDKSHLFLHLYKGELFENVQNGSMGFNSGSYLPFRRESFDDKQVYIMFDANFNRIDESGMRAQYIGKNISELRYAIDSINHIVDSIGNIFGNDLKQTSYLGIPYYTTKDVNGKAVRVKQTPVKTTKKINVDSVFNAPNSSMARTYLNQALSKAKRQEMEFEFKSALLTDQQKSMRRHDIEMERKFTLSLACLIFFFIGAPLGAIIKKGGLGTPLVISVILFVIYYIFDNIGYKMAKDGKTEVWFGIWLSSMVLLPMGVFFTYKAIGESSVFDFDTYRRFLRRVFHIAEKRRIAFKEVVMDVPDNSELNEKLCVFNSKMEARIERRKKMAFFRRPFINVSNAQLREEFDALVVAMSYSRDQHVINLLNEYPVNITSRNASSIVATGKAISKLLVPESEVIDKNEVQSNEQPEAVDDENTATIEDTTDSDYGTEN